MNVGTIHLLPIEPFEERYTEQWYRWWQDGLRNLGFEVNVISGTNIGERKGGQWLSPVKTWIWKGRQMENLARQWENGNIRDHDVILSLDMWNSCLTSALYMKFTTKSKVRIGGFYHAGASDPNDFLANTGCRKWALDIERGWVKGLDFILCGSNFAGRMLRKNLGLWKDVGAKIYATGYPFNVEEIVSKTNYVSWEDRERIVVFPHRLADEKQPHLFIELRHKYFSKYGNDGTKFIRTRDVCKNKQEYYDLLAKSKVSFSAAKQETFGIAQQEAAILGCHVLNPMCLSYPEVTRETGLMYEPYNMDKAASILKILLDSDKSPHWDGYHEKAIQRAADVLTGKSVLRSADYLHPTMIDPLSFWQGTFEDQKTVFIEEIPKDFVGKMLFMSQDFDEYDSIYFTDKFDFSIERNRKFFYSCIDSDISIVVARNHGFHDCLYWERIHQQKSDRFKIVYKVFVDKTKLKNCYVEVGEPYNSVVFREHQEITSYKNDRT